MAANVFRLLQKLEPDCAVLLTNDNWQSVTKTRFVDEKSNHHFVRVDSSHVFNPLEIDIQELAKYEIIAISDYNKGFLSEAAIQKICENHPNVFIDTKKPVKTFAQSAKFIKINDFEYQNSKPYLTPELEAKIIHTAGENGCYFGEKHFPVNKVEVKDVSGAGDSFFAALILSFLAKGDIDYAIRFANSIASETVKHRGVS
jgi:D-beta-D-heptose 7-phosphate kinase/D-beta-D-heptose 1-phosphate adenosyltransferase